MKRVIRFLIIWGICLSVAHAPGLIAAQSAAPSGGGKVAVIDMDMMILPGTQGYLENAIERAEAEGAKLLVVQLSTPGGMLSTTQKMIQAIFESPIPVVIYVGPSGGSTATSAGVFITLAGHVAAMAPGTSMGAAHPVSSDGKDIEGDMRKKVEEFAIAMIKSIAEHRGRNVKWAEKSVKESSSITETEALKMGVVDLVADDLGDLLKRIKGKEVKIGSSRVVLEDYSNLPRVHYQMGLQNEVMNVLANPTVAALLWLGATAGISLELYNPGSIIPGVIGVICLIIALAVSQVIPVTSGGILLLVVGAALLASELFFTNGFLGVAGLVAIVIGSLTLIDVSQAPGLQVSMEVVIPFALLVGMGLLLAVRATVKTFRRQPRTGTEGIIGMTGEAKGPIAEEGRVFVDGELWSATAIGEPVEDGEKVVVVGAHRHGLLLEVKSARVVKSQEE